MAEIIIENLINILGLIIIYSLIGKKHMLLKNIFKTICLVVFSVILIKFKYK